MTQWVFSFGDGEAEGKAEMRNLLGGKGANLAQMANLGLPVPPGFTITTEVCTYYYANGQAYPDDLVAQVEAALARVEKATGKVLGGDERPLLLSVRSGARASMPGMMDTILNLGLNERTVEVLAASADRRFAYDSFRRFIQMYSDVVLGIDHHLFEERLEDFKDERSYSLDTEMSGDDWSELVHDYKVLVERESGAPFPEDPPLGATVRIRADDHAQDPIVGELVQIDADEIALRRNDPLVGEVVVHFPRLGYELRAA